MYDINANYGSSLDATTNSIPTGLTHKPYAAATANSDGSFSINTAIIANWTSQGKKAFIRTIPDDAPLKMVFTPSGGNAVTWSITLWGFNAVNGTWYKFNDTPSSYTGNNTILLDNPGRDPVYVQLNSLSSGTMRIDYNGDAYRTA